jgi:hypothetical protein
VSNTTPELVTKSTISSVLNDTLPINHKGERPKGGSPQQKRLLLTDAPESRRDRTLRLLAGLGQPHAVIDVAAEFDFHKASTIARGRK